MSVLYLECKMGAAGDMLMGALYDLLPQKKQDVFLQKMNDLGLPGITVRAEEEKTCGITGKKMYVEIGGQEEVQEDPIQFHSHLQEHRHFHAHDHSHGHFHQGEQDSHQHNTYSSILHRISHLPLSDQVKTHICEIYRLIGDAESKVHQTELEQIHFHEVGTLDALADVTGCCILMDMLRPDRIVVSPVCAGNGYVRCAHGVLPVPAPATAEIMKDVPMYASSFDGELLTPTGAAILKYFAHKFAVSPPLCVKHIGYGIGTKKYENANCVRAFLGEEIEVHETDLEDEIVELCCNLDDMTPEELGVLYDLAFQKGALDVYTVPIGMKKNRSGWMLCVLCKVEDRENMQMLLLKHTSSRGVRFRTWNRKKLTSSFQQVETEYGTVTLKISTGYGICKAKPEYEDVVQAAEKAGVTYRTVAESVQRQWHDNRTIRTKNGCS